MQWHWGNIGSFLAGLSTLIIAGAALRQGPAAVRAWLDLKRAQADAAREQANAVRLDRQRRLSGWSAHSIDTYGVALVSEEEELALAARELLGGGPTAYVVLRVAEHGHAVVNRGKSLRDLVEREGSISRSPTAGEKEALRNGLDAMGISRSDV